MTKIPDMPKPRTIIPKEFKNWGKPPRMKPFDDPDKDGYPNLIDCSDHNPRKQGIGQNIKEKIGGLVTRYKEKQAEYKAKEPERRAEQLDRIKYRTQLLEEEKKQQMIKTDIARQRSNRQLEQIKIMNQKSKSMGGMPSMMGFGMGFGGGSGFGSVPTMPRINPMNPLESLRSMEQKPRTTTKRQHRRSSKKKK